MFKYIEDLIYANALVCVVLVVVMVILSIFGRRRVFQNAWISFVVNFLTLLVAVAIYVFAKSEGLL